VRVRDLRSRTRHDHLRQGVIGGDAADLGIAGQREDLPGDARREPQARKFRPRLYLLGAPGRGGRRARGAAHLRGDGPSRPCRARRRAYAARAPPARRPSAGRRRARRRPPRRPRHRRRQGDPRDVRPRASGAGDHRAQLQKARADPAGDRHPDRAFAARNHHRKRGSTNWSHGSATRSTTRSPRSRHVRQTKQITVQQLSPAPKRRSTLPVRQVE